MTNKKKYLALGLILLSMLLSTIAVILYFQQMEKNEKKYDVKEIIEPTKINTNNLNTKKSDTIEDVLNKIKKNDKIVEKIKIKEYRKNTPTKKEESLTDENKKLIEENKRLRNLLDKQFY